MRAYAGDGGRGGGVLLVVLRLLLAGALVLGLASACGGAGEPAPRAAPAPTDPAPPAGESAPPPAWLETESGSHRLGYSTFCWKNLCADAAAPACDSEHVPRIGVRSGERVRYHLGFEPEGQVTLTRFDGDRAHEQTELGDGAEGEWTVEDAGPFSLFAAAETGGDASYVACLVVE